MPSSQYTSQVFIVWLQKVSILPPPPPPPQKVIRNSKGEGGGVKAKPWEEKYEDKLEFLVGEGGTKWKTFYGGSMDIFWNYTLE